MKSLAGSIMSDYRALFRPLLEYTDKKYTISFNN